MAIGSADFNDDKHFSFNNIQEILNHSVYNTIKHVPTCTSLLGLIRAGIDIKATTKYKLA